VDGNTVKITLPTITGFVPKSGYSASVAISGDTELIAVYVPEGTPPYFTGLTPAIDIQVNDPLDLREGVRAFDNIGTELTSKIEIFPQFIDTSYAKSHNVWYIVRDAGGRAAKMLRVINVGVDPMEVEIAGGWMFSDFAYSSDGKTLNGLSINGAAKFNAGNTEVTLPGYCPRPTGGGSNVPIEKINNGTSSAPTFPQNFIEIFFDRMISLKTIGDYAFSDVNRTIGTTCISLDLSACKSLEVIGQYAFARARLTSLT
jgi:hypothetical protein